tara:strand:- start:298 stop:543 length:246 start_codon:yes stop_codon:yes gene_type:complete
MKFIGSEQLKFTKAIKDGKVVDKDKDNLITMPTNTTISFGDMVFTVDPKSGKTTYSIIMTVTHTDPSNGKQTVKVNRLDLA